MLADTRYIAALTVVGLDVLAIWNFRHMVNLCRIRQYKVVCRLD